jgi:hypothetical protein
MSARKILDDEWAAAPTMPPFEAAHAASELDDHANFDGIEYGVILWPLVALVLVIIGAAVAVLL